LLLTFRRKYSSSSLPSILPPLQ